MIAIIDLYFFTIVQKRILDNKSFYQILFVIFKKYALTTLNGCYLIIKNMTGVPIFRRMLPTI